MMKRLIIAAVAGAFAVTSAFAADTPKNKEDCFNQAFKLAESAEGKELSDSQAESLEKKLTDMETACESEKFADAATVASSIESDIGN